MKIAHGALIILLVLPLGNAWARPQQTAPPPDQQQNDSLAAASRRAQEQKKDQKKAAKVWDNDNLPTAPGAVSVVGQTPAAASPAGDAVSENAADETNASGATPEGKPADHVDVGALEDQLKDLRTDLDILQRKYTLDQQTYYGKTNYAADKAGAAALQDEKAQIDAKQQEIDDIQNKLNSLH